MVTAGISTAVWGGLTVLYILLLVTLGIIGLRKGHWVLFVLGFFLPLLWLIGALLVPVADPRSDDGRR